MTYIERRRVADPGVNLSKYTLARVREMGGDVAAYAEQQLEFAREEAQRVRSAWLIEAAAVQAHIIANPHPHSQTLEHFALLERKLKGETGPGINARRSIYRAVGKLPRGWTREVFRRLPPAKTPLL